jgi:hypothetical protein|tara:strand:- start:214 stop:582 length:369 start_codon:yes stop_codon:yes gene_type:complete
MKQLEEKNSQIPQVKANNGNSSYSKNGHLLAVTFSKIANNLEDVMFVKNTINPREEWVLEKPDYFTAWVRTKEEGNIKIEAKTFDLVIATAKDLSKKYNKNILIYAVRDQSDSCYGTYKRGE